ncbi:hypothetical protein BW723_13225 [Polaribacter reichenbachii]|uniref:Uncharacterized protein n=1 Tax=Polaribacter reichenbachii TaxID=996801 RepID=A0A1B8TZS8_9FLAO|nr:hypothetical protein [Polaribacter reichenbachii]APZ47186.1 hypothetical protein BW723_13225 [Polaribacter reichenbachii]AUC17826.1 hypothetical protein BTO17_03670 [Polaribacter reichenbachii]OBY65150.1 hypothetical protein LPB301_08555 [Polaribacter reichenbachii]
MFTQILDSISSVELASQAIEYTVLTTAFFSFFVLTSKVIKVIKTNESRKALLNVNIQGEY